MCRTRKPPYPAILAAVCLAACAGDDFTTFAETETPDSGETIDANQNDSAYHDNGMLFSDSDAEKPIAIDAGQSGGTSGGDSGATDGATGGNSGTGGSAGQPSCTPGTTSKYCGPNQSSTCPEGTQWKGACVGSGCTPCPHVLCLCL